MEHIQNIELIFQEPSSDNVPGKKITHVKRVSEGSEIYYELIWNSSIKEIWAFFCSVINILGLELFSLGGGFFCNLGLLVIFEEGRHLYS